MRKINLVISAVLFSSCIKKNANNTQSIQTQNGNEAIGLIVGRLHISNPLASNSSTNAFRAVMMPVRCDAAGIRKLEIVSVNPDNIHHSGSRIVDVDGNSIPQAENCVIAGNYNLHPYGMDSIFSHPPTTQDEFDRQQMVWLAFRGEVRSEDASFPISVVRMFGEAGLFKGQPAAASLANIKIQDQIFNPCIAADPSKKYQFDKNLSFSCADYKYISKNDKISTRWLDVIAESTQNLIKAIDDGNYDPQFAEGLKDALIVNKVVSPVGSQLALGEKVRQTFYKYPYNASNRMNPKAPFALAGLTVSGAPTKPNPPCPNRQNPPAPSNQNIPPIPGTVQNSNAGGNSVVPNSSSSSVIPKSGSSQGSVLNYGDGSQFIAQNVNGEMSDYAGAGSIYNTFRMVNPTTGVEQYADVNKATGNTDWYSRNKTDGSFKYLETVTPNSNNLPTGAMSVPVTNSQKYTGWEFTDVTNAVAKSYKTQNDVANLTQYFNAKTKEYEYCTQSNDGSYAWTRMINGKEEALQSVDSKGKVSGDYKYDSYNNQWMNTSNPSTPSSPVNTGAATDGSFTGTWEPDPVDKNAGSGGGDW